MACAVRMQHPLSGAVRPTVVALAQDALTHLFVPVTGRWLGAGKRMMRSGLRKIREAAVFHCFACDLPTLWSQPCRCGGACPMSITRRVFGIGALSVGLAGCGLSGPGDAVARPGTDLPADLRPAPNAAFEAWVRAYRRRAADRGVLQSTLTAAFRGTGYLPGVVRRDRSQTEFTRTLEDYLSIAVSDDRVQNGREAFARHRATLTEIERQYGVDASVICAIWGVESFYGERRGRVPVISATATLAFDGRRGAFFERQLDAALLILQNGDVAPAKLTGSWAGAMGHTQFIPTSYLEFAVDFTGDGRRDIWADDPTDALASAAAYLQRNGWRTGLSWGREARDGSLHPQPGGPRFATTANFRVLKRYNNSDAYAIGVGHLSDRIVGAGTLRAAFPPDANGLTKTDRIRLQTRLTEQGFDTQGADGVIGRNTEAAIRAYQTARGAPVTGQPSRVLLQSLR